MVSLSLTGLTAAAGGLAISLITGAGIASADPVSDPDLDRVVNSTCTYNQAVAALDANYPDTAAQFNASPIATGFLRQFVDSPPDQRLQMAHQVEGMPDAAPYLDTMKQVAKVCNRY